MKNFKVFTDSISPVMTQEIFNKSQIQTGSVIISADYLVVGGSGQIIFCLGELKSGKNGNIVAVVPPHTFVVCEDNYKEFINDKQ